MKPEKSINYYMRTLHRDIGCFLIGLTIIYCISGIMLIYRDTHFLKEPKLIERHLPPNIKEQELGMILHMRNFKVLRTEGDVIYFINGTYNKATGVANYSAETLPLTLEKFNNFHKLSTKNPVHWFSLMYAILLLFLAISSFWMYKPKSKSFRRGIIIASTGFISVIIILFFIKM